MTNWDFFICHASEDKEEFVRPLANELIKRGFTVWFDEFSLTLGDSLSKSIDNGIANSRYGIIVLSTNFFAKQWPQRELNSLATLEMTMGEKKLLHVWHKLSQHKVSKFSPTLADKYAVSNSKGLEFVIKEIMRLFSSAKVSKDIESIVNDILKPIIEALVDNPNCFSLTYVEGERTAVIELHLYDDSQWGRIIGKKGVIAKSIRIILAAIGAFKLEKRLILELVEHR